MSILQSKIQQFVDHYQEEMEFIAWTLFQEILAFMEVFKND